MKNPIQALSIAFGCFVMATVGCGVAFALTLVHGELLWATFYSILTLISFRCMTRSSQRYIRVVVAAALSNHVKYQHPAPKGFNYRKEALETD